MASDPVRNQDEDIQKKEVKQCEQTPVAKFTKTQVHYYLIPSVLLIGAILIGSLLIPLLFPTTLLSETPTILIAKSSVGNVPTLASYVNVSRIKNVTTLTISATGGQGAVTLSGNLHRTCPSFPNYVGCNFSAPVPYQTIYLCNAATNQEFASTNTTKCGDYSFTFNENSPGTYYAHFKGNSQDKPRTSETVSVSALPLTDLTLLPTYLAFFAPYSVQQGADFTLSGSLQKACDWNFLSNQAIHLYDKNNQELTSTQTELGFYSFTWHESSPGTYHYYARFEGDSQYMPYRSEMVDVTVSS